MEYIENGCEPRTSEKPKSILEDDELLYLQPAKRDPIAYIRPYKKPTVKVDSETTYSRSYMKYDCKPKLKIDFGPYKDIAIRSTGKFDFDTTYKLSYQLTKGMPSKAYIPEPCLSINGSHDMISTQALSYKNPGYSRAVICMPYRGKICYPAKMDSQTVTKDSYQNFNGLVKVKRPSKPLVWQTKFKTDYQTTNQLSYQWLTPSKRMRGRPSRPIITEQIEKDTVYSTSYRVPGRFVNKKRSVRT